MRALPVPNHKNRAKGSDEALSNGKFQDITALVKACRSPPYEIGEGDREHADRCPNAGIIFNLKFRQSYSGWLP